MFATTPDNSMEDYKVLSHLRRPEIYKGGLSATVEKNTWKKIPDISLVLWKIKFPEFSRPGIFSKIVPDIPVPWPGCKKNDNHSDIWYWPQQLCCWSSCQNWKQYNDSN